MLCRTRAQRGAGFWIQRNQQRGLPDTLPKFRASGDIVPLQLYAALSLHGATEDISYAWGWGMVHGYGRGHAGFMRVLVRWRVSPPPQVVADSAYEREIDCEGVAQRATGWPRRSACAKVSRRSLPWCRKDRRTEGAGTAA